jgi:hypothetical protein
VCRVAAVGLLGMGLVQSGQMDGFRGRDSGRRPPQLQMGILAGSLELPGLVLWWYVCVGSLKVVRSLRVCARESRVMSHCPLVGVLLSPSICPL